MGHILIVDDHAGVRASVCRLLASGGYPARAVADAAEALHAMRTEPPALVLLDVGMPGVSGLGVLRAAAADPSLTGVPIVMISADEDPGTRDEAARLGARGFVVKGRNWPEALWQVVGRFLYPRDFDEGPPPHRPMDDAAAPAPSATPARD